MSYVRSWLILVFLLVLSFWGGWWGHSRFVHPDLVARVDSARKALARAAAVADSARREIAASHRTTDSLTALFAAQTAKADAPTLRKHAVESGERARTSVLQTFPKLETLPTDSSCIVPIPCEVERFRQIRDSLAVVERDSLRDSLHLGALTCSVAVKRVEVSRDSIAALPREKEMPLWGWITTGGAVLSAVILLLSK